MDAADRARVIDLATRAPSIHNTQPWRFRWDGDVLDVYADRTRALPVLDPSARQLHISCGGAVENARLAVRVAGRACLVELLPTADPDHLARLSVQGEEPASPRERELAHAIPLRHTDRRPFDAREVPGALLDRLRGEAEHDGVWVRVLQGEEETATIAVLSDAAERFEQQDERYTEELARWRRERGDAVDGIPLDALEGISEQGVGSALHVRDFLPDRTAAPSPAGSSPGTAADPDPDPPRVERPQVVLLETREDTNAAWLRAGSALSQLLLACTVEHVSASPLTQVLDVPSTREALRAELGLIGRPQMLLRLGYGSGGTGTPRRPVTDVLEPPASG